MIISKQQAIKVFGSGAELGRAISVGRSAISKWPEKLDQRRTDLVIGAALRLGKLSLIAHEVFIGCQWSGKHLISQSNQLNTPDHYQLECRYP